MVADNRNAILEGAGSAFARLGYGACRVEDIIEDAGVSRATFYKFFDSKEQVFDTVEDAFYLSFVTAIQGAIRPDLSPAEQADALLEAYLRWITGWRVLARTLWTDATRPRAQTLRDTREAAFKDFVDAIADLNVARGAPPADPFVSRGIIAAISEIGMALTEMPRVTEKDIQRARAAIIHMIVATLSSQPVAIVKKPSTSRRK